MEDSVFFKYHTERSLHRELTNIFFFAQMNQNTITIIVMKMDSQFVRFEDFVSIFETVKLIIFYVISFYN